MTLSVIEADEAEYDKIKNEPEIPGLVPWNGLNSKSTDLFRGDHRRYTMVRLTHIPHQLFRQEQALFVIHWLVGSGTEEQVDTEISPRTLWRIVPDKAPVTYAGITGIRRDNTVT